MSQPATERTAPAPAAGGNVLTRKIGPLPGWAWGGIAIAAGVGYIWWRNRQSAAAGGAAATDTGTATTDAGVDQSSTDAVLQSEIQNLQGAESAETPGTPAAATTKSITVPRNETLSQLAKNDKWTAATYKAIQALNGLHPSSKLKRGQKILRPVAPPATATTTATTEA